MNYIPDVFVIGAMKAGTTTLYNSVLQHPDICLTKTKEVNFFLKKYSYEKLNLLYNNQFKSSRLIKIDISPSYAKCHIFPGVAERIYQANPKAKIIFIARDPLDRLISHLQHNLLRDRFDAIDINEEVFRNKDYILTSSYAYQLQDYIKLFGKENVLVLIFEDFQHNPQKLLDSLMKFLEIKNLKIEKKVHYSSESRYKIKYYDTIHKVFDEGKLTKFYHYFWCLLNIKVSKPKLDFVLQNKLAKELHPDTMKFIELNEISLKDWVSFMKHFSYRTDSV